MRRKNGLLLLTVCVLVVLVASIAYTADVLTRHDKVALGPTAFSTGRLNFAPATAATGGIYFGSDVTLYRSAANTLKTDDALVVTGATTVTDLTTTGTVAVGNASTDTCTMTGRLIVRSVTDAGPMTATGGTQGEIVFNTSDSKFYGCTVTHATAATWVTGAAL